MENDINVLIVVIISAVSAFLLIMVKLVWLLSDFGRERQYLLTEMDKADDYNEYRYWRRELRCRYLCLIPFVNERNVMKIYGFLFHRKMRKGGSGRFSPFLHILAPSVIAVGACAVCLCGVSWAWYTASAGVGVDTIRTAVFQIENVQILSDDGQASAISFDENGRYTTEGLEPNKYMLSFRAAEGDTSSENGYCRITVFESGKNAGTVYYSSDIGKEVYTLTVITAKTVTLKIEPVWGNVKNRVSENDNVVASGGKITIADSGTATQQRGTGQAPDTQPSAVRRGTPDADAEEKKNEIAVQDNGVADTTGTVSQDGKTEQSDTDARQPSVSTGASAETTACETPGVESTAEDSYTDTQCMQNTDVETGIN